MPASAVSNNVVQFFHLTYFGGMRDNDKAYGWANNVANNDRKNPELYAQIAAVIELRNRDGQKYTVSAEGNVATVWHWVQFPFFAVAKLSLSATDWDCSGGGFEEW